MLLRIFYISPGTDLGGGEISLLTLIANLNRSHYMPIICTYGDGRFAECAKKLGCSLHIFSYNSLLSQPGFVIKLANLIRKENADLVHVNTLDIRAGIATKLAARPLVGHLRVIFPTTWVDRTFVKLADKTISVSNAVRDHFCQTEGTPASAFETIYNAVDAHAKETGPRLYEELNLAPNTPFIGAVGRLDPWKGMETFIEAAGILHETYPDIHFVIAGRPGPAQEEQAYATSLGRRVETLGMGSIFHFLGFRSDALSVIRQLDILVVPSRELITPKGIKTEGFGRVAAEGLAMQTPVIASCVGGLPEIIEDGKTGRLFEAGNVKALVEIIVDLLKHPDKKKMLVKNGYEKFQSEFTVKKHVDRIQSLYDNLLKK